MSLHLKDPPTTDYLTKPDNIYSDLCAALDRYKGGQILSSWLRISQFYLIVKHVEQPLNIHFFTHLLYPCCSREFQGLGECHYKCSAPTTCFCSICKRPSFAQGCPVFNCRSCLHLIIQPLCQIWQECWDVAAQSQSHPVLQ